MLATSTPPRNILKVGIALTPYCCETSLHSSTSTLMNFACVRSPAIAAYLGAICWHGPHHVAKKSTTTSCLDFADASCRSKSAFECTAITEPALAGLAAPPLRVGTPVAVKPFAPGFAAAGGGGGGGGGVISARTRGGLPGKAACRNACSHAHNVPVPAIASAPPRSERTTGSVRPWHIPATLSP
eukprot:scaffold1172_cov124-Isochrysis_galbana.AAC.2